MLRQALSCPGDLGAEELWDGNLATNTARKKTRQLSGGHPGIEPGTSRRMLGFSLSENHTTRPAALDLNAVDMCWYAVPRSKLECGVSIIMGNTKRCDAA